jgi:hypothetical protein
MDIGCVFTMDCGGFGDLLDARWSVCGVQNFLVN